MWKESRETKAEGSLDFAEEHVSLNHRLSKEARTNAVDDAGYGEELRVSPPVMYEGALKAPYLKSGVAAPDLSWA